jgi:phosphohistidine phosphatase SixA
MLELWIMRHGEAVSPEEASSDAERSLTDFGRRQVAGLARWLQGRIELPEQIWHSPLRRARQTATVVAEELGIVDRLREVRVMSPGMSAERLLRELSAIPATPILCVGHQPDVGRCVSELIGGGRFDIPPGFCACVAFRGPLAVGAGSVQWVADPNWFGG